MTAIFAPSTCLVAIIGGGGGGDGDPSSAVVTLPLGAFSAAILLASLLGGIVGYYVAGCRGSSRGQLFGAREAKMSGGPTKPSDESDDARLIALDGIEKKNDKVIEGEEEDGPTMVLRGSLDLMAAKWGDRRKEKESAVVEYLSPDEMTHLLFSRVTNNGSNASTTLCLDECPYYGAARRGDAPSPRSSTADITGLLSASDVIKNEGESEGSVITPQAFLHLLSLVQKYSVNTSHPYFFNQLFGSLDPIALAAEVVALSVNTSVYTYETAPVFTLMEREVMSQIGKLVFGNNLISSGDGEGDKAEGPEEEEFEGEGLMIPGGSLANLTAMHAARHRWRVVNGYTKQQEDTSDVVDECSSSSFEEEKKQDEDPHLHEYGEGSPPLLDSSSSSSSSTTPQNEGSRRSNSQIISCQSNDQSPLYDHDRSEPDLVAFVSSEAHYSFSKSARVLGLREDDLIVVPTHSDGRMDVRELAKKIEELELDLQQNDDGVGDVVGAGLTMSANSASKRNRVPFFVACTAGSTVRGSFDDVAEIVKVCRDYELRGDGDDGISHGQHSRSIWVHVDGAWGGSAIFSSRPSLRSAARADEIRHADSFTFNPHKMLGAPQQTTAFIVRHRHALRDANAAGAKYLFDPRKNGAEYDLGDLSYTCGRRTDAVKLWALWKYYGRSGLGRRLDQKVDELELFVKEIGKRRGRFALACKPWPFNVNFFYFPPRIRQILEARGILPTSNDLDCGGLERVALDGYIQIPDDVAQDLANISVLLKLRLHEAGEMIIPYQPLSNQKADCFRLVLAGKKNFGLDDIRHVLDTMETYGADL